MNEAPNMTAPRAAFRQWRSRTATGARSLWSTAMEWKTVCRCNNYEVSDAGDVRNATTKKHLAQADPGTGYLIVFIGRKSQRVHVMVAEAFIGPRPTNKVIHHKNHNKHDNRASNLGYTTNRDNILNAIRNGRSTTIRIPQKIKTLMRFAFEQGWTRREIAELFNTRVTRVSSILR